MSGALRSAPTWDYYFSVQSSIAGIVLGVVLESGIGTVIALGVVYAVLAWFFARRHHWAWITLTILSFNPLLWLINLVYLRRRWAEDSVVAKGERTAVAYAPA